MNQLLASTTTTSQLSVIEAASLLRERLAQVDVEQAIHLIAHVSAEQVSTSSVQMQGYQLATVLRFLLESENNPRGIRQLDEEGLAYCCELTTSYVSSANTAFGVEVSDNALSLEHRLAYQQLPDHEEKRYVPRSIHVYRKIAPTLQEDTGFHFEKAFSDAHGLTLDQYWAIGYAIYKLCKVYPGESFSLKDLADALGHEVKKVEYFLRLNTCSYESYRAMLDVPDGKNSHFEPYNLNPLRKLSILELPNAEFIVPIPSFLLRRITHGLYYDLIELGRSEYIRTIGKAFNTYARQLIEEHGEVIASEDGASWILRDSDTTLIVRPITRPFGALSRTTGNYDDIRNDLARSRGLVDGVVQLQRELDSEGNGNAIGVMVALEDFYLGNGHLIRKAINDELEGRGQQEIDESIQLTHINGLEALSQLSLNSGSKLLQILGKKVEDERYKTLDLEVYARHLASELLSDFDLELIPNVLTSTKAKFLV